MPAVKNDKMDEVMEPRKLTNLRNKIVKLIRANAFLYHALRYLYFQLWVRFVEHRQFLRFAFFRRLRNMSAFLSYHKMVGGLMEVNGDYYLKTLDGFFIYYNYTDFTTTMGDGQSLEFQPNAGEPYIESFVLNNVSDLGVYLDIGANNGYHYAMKVARAHPISQIHCFEPDASILQHLCKNISFNRLTNIHVHPVALSSESGVAEMTKNLGASGYLVMDGDETVSKVHVDVDTLDNFIVSNDISTIDLIKVDIEGGELNFLRGGEKTLEKIRPTILMEMNDTLLRRSGGSTDDVVSLLSAHRYSCYRVDGTNDSLAVPLEKIESTEFGKSDCLTKIA